MIQVISSPNSPVSRKRSFLDVVHKLKKQKKTLVEKKAHVVVESDHNSDDINIEMGGSFHVSL